jgi:uncharacterized protein (TIGR03437 family)
LRLADQAGAARAGDVLVIYGAGLGQADQSLAEGIASPAEPPACTVNTVTMTIGGKAAVVLFAGLAPGFAGLYQINAVVPEGVAAGNQVPVIVSAAGQSSPPVTIAVE